MTTTAPSGAYTVGQALDAPLTTGWHKLTLKASSPITKAMLSKLQSTPGTFFWDRVIRPQMVSAAAKNGVKIKVPANSFYMNKNGQVRSTLAPGYQFILRKGYDAKTATFWYWIEVQGAV